MTRVATLAALLGAEVRGSTEVEVTDVTHDSRSVAPGALFCCITGAHQDGHLFADAAVASGAVALLCERALPIDVAQLVVPDARAAMAHAAAEVFGHPSEHMGVVGVTGTNGKTTVVSMVAAILEHSGRVARSIGTLTGERTTPESPDLQRQLAGMLAEGVTEVAMEVSSHALVLHRVDGVAFDVAVFTNLGVDHLDFHETPEAYFAAKARLFESGRSRVGIVNVDDVHGRLLMDASDFEVRGVSIDDAADLVSDGDGSRYVWRDVRVALRMTGRHNVLNALLAGEACLELGLLPAQVAAGLAAMPAVPGRFETFRWAASGGRAATAVVDYAHTPDALEAALLAARGIADPGGRLTVVFGCGGDRDRGKRPMMGDVATRLADRIIITTDNPRSEDPLAIIAEIRTGLEERTEQIEDRRDAIGTAMSAAVGGDVVLVAGKGHEQGQTFVDHTEPFDDRSVVREEIGRLDPGSADAQVGS